MKGIEAAFFGTVASERIELKTGRSGTLWTVFSVGVTIGSTDDGKELLQWLRVSAFAETAERVAATFKKGDRCYVEGSLKLDTWNDKATGEPKHGLNVSAFKVEKVGVSNLGRNRPKREIDHQFAQGEPAPYVHSGTPITASSYAGPAYRREKPRIQGLNDDFDDRLPF
jgi:single-strand DNA-binding protein